jgi:hypothetical protein
MFTSFNRYVQDARTLAKLCSAAEEIARAHGRAKPGSEHFVLAALGFADKTACEAFKHLSLTEAAFLDALTSQHEAALASIGISLPTMAGEPAQTLVPPKGSLYETEPSGKSLVQRLADSRGTRKGRHLLSADILFAVAQETYTSASRAFRTLGISAAQLTDAASAAIVDHTSGEGDASQVDRAK